VKQVKSRRRRSFQADADQLFGGADVEAAVGDGGGGVDGRVEFGGGEALELGAGFDDDEIALLTAAVDFAVGGAGLIWKASSTARSSPAR
jgi:hypothetical protein